MKVYLCSCIFHEDAKEEEIKVEEEGHTLLEKAADVESCKKASGYGKEADAVISQSLDIFKGILCIFMVYSHVNLCLVNATEVYYTKLGHFVGNVASSCCFNGFVFSFGYTCYLAYLSDLKPRPFAQVFERVMRSAMLPVVGAWVCSFAWSYMCFKVPIGYDSAKDIVTFYYVWGNGPDFLLSFTTLLLTSYAYKVLLHPRLFPMGTSPKVLMFGAFLMLALPLMLTWFVIPDCTGMKRYMQVFLVCDKREPVGMVNLPALPHFFFFNLGVLASVGLQKLKPKLNEMSAVELLTEGANKAFLFIFIAEVVLAICAYPLYTVWWSNYGNLMIQSKFGWIIRGWSRGPTILWIVGTLFGIYNILLFAFALSMTVRYGLRAGPAAALDAVGKWLEHLGANVLIYLVVSDCLLAGMYNPNSFPLSVNGAGVATFIMLFAIKFIHYLGQSGRK